MAKKRSGKISKGKTPKGLLMAVEMAVPSLKASLSGKGKKGKKGK